MPSVVQGFNLAIISIGSSGSGKSYTLGGSASDMGIIHYFVDGLFNSLNSRLDEEPGVSNKYTIRMQFIEIVNEEIYDLLGNGKHSPIVELDEWETVSIQGAERKTISNPEQFAEIYSIGVQNKITSTNEFGRLSDKAANILTLDLIQTSESSVDTQVLVSKISFVECPGTEILSQAPETVLLKQGPTLNQAIMNMYEITTDLASGKVGKSNYDASVFTKALTEILGGNTIGIGIFNFQCDDLQGSGPTMKMLKHFKRITNFPISNDNKAICLLHKFRKECLKLKNVIYGAGGETVEQYQAKITELEKKLIGVNMGSMQFDEERKGMMGKLIELKDKYNAMVRQKAEVQAQLVNAEEEKLSLTKGIMEQQIKNTKLQEEIQRIKYDQDYKGVRRDTDIHILQSGREKAQKTIMDLQDSLNKATKERKEFELELMTVRRNYLNKCKEAEDLKKKNEQISMEFISALNENKEIMGNMGVSRGSRDDFEKYNKKITALEMDKQKLREELARAAAEIEKINNDKLKSQVITEQIKLEYQKKKESLEKDYVAMARNRDVKIDEGKKINNEDGKNVWKDDKLELARKIKELYRKLEITTAELNDAKEENEELKKAKKALEEQLDELTDTCRNKLVNMTEQESRNELIRTYSEKENRMIADLEDIKEKMVRLRLKCRTLREYSRQLRYLCEDIYPEDRVKPDILQDEPPYMINEEQGDMGENNGAARIEIKRLEDQNRALKLNIDQLNEKLRKVNESADSHIQKQIIDELKMLKENPKVASRPSSAIEELEKIRKERNRLLEENVRLKKIVFCLITFIDRSRFNWPSIRW